MKKIFFIQVILISIVFFYPFKSHSYSSDPKQFISEVVIEAKTILNQNDSKESKSEN